MTRLLLTGLPGTGKTELVEQTKQIAGKLGVNVHSISLGDIFKQIVRKIGANHERPLYIDSITQDAVRSGIISRCANILTSLPRNDHVIIDAPLTLLDTYGVHSNTFDITDFKTFGEVKKSLDLVVTLIDDEVKIAKNLDAHKFPTQPEKILSWTTCEISRARDIAGIYTNKNFPLVIPRENSRTSLIKLLTDYDNTTAEHPIPITYSARPLSGIKKMEQKGGKYLATAIKARQAIQMLDDAMQEMSVVVVPMEQADLRPSKLQAAHITHRDKNNFIRMTANNVVAHYAIDIFSSGTNDEVKVSRNDLAKLTTLIHPNADQTPFGYKEIPYTAYLFKTHKEFLNAVASSPHKERYAPYRMFLDGAGQPRYKNIMDADRELFPRKIA